MLHSIRQSFIVMVRHEHVPSGFSKGIIVPLMKDKFGDVCSSAICRPIRLVRIFSKVFEMFIFNFCADNLVINYIQFDFIKDLDCANAIFTFRTTIDYSTDRVSSIYASFLYISKAFDTLNHYTLLCSIMTVDFLKCLVAMLNIWYSNLKIVVRWNILISNTLSVSIGITQGNILCPSLFDIFINLVV